MCERILAKARNMKFNDILFGGPGVAKYGQTNGETESGSSLTHHCKLSFPWRTAVQI